MKKLRRVIGSVANLTSNRNEDQPAASAPRPSVLSHSRRSVSGTLHETSPQRGSYYSYETQSLDSFNSGLSCGTPQVDPYSKVDKQFTKLHKWAYLGDINKLKKFIKKVPVDAQDGEGKTSLHHAAAQGHGDALLFLLGSKSNVEIKDSAGMTAFLRAVEKSQQHIVQLLIQRRVDTNVTDYQGNSSIHLASRTGATDLLLLLLECGSDCDSPNTLGRTPLHVACAENQEEAVEALLRHGAGVNMADKEGVTPLMMAAKIGSVPLVEMLIDNGANISPMDASKWTAADYARFTNHNQLYHRLKTLLDKEGGVSMIPQGLLSVSDEGSDQTEAAAAAAAAAAGIVEKPSDNAEEDAADNSWSDTSDVNSVKEKPKLNLTKFLPSSDESIEKVGTTITDIPEGALGPPKPPRLHASSSSLASDKLMAGRSDETQGKADSVKDSDSWKSSSEDEELKIKSLGLIKGDLDTSTDLRKRKDDLNPNITTRVGSEDLMLELGLKDMKYQLSDEEVSFEGEKPELPLEETPTEVIISPRNKTSQDHKRSSSIGSCHTSASDELLPSTNKYKDSLENESGGQLFSSTLGSAKSSNSKLSLLKSPVTSHIKRSPKKAKFHRQKSIIFDSDSDEGGSASPHPHKRKSSTPKKQAAAAAAAASLGQQLSGDKNFREMDVDSPKSNSLNTERSRKSSKNSSQDSLSENWETEKMRPSSGRSAKSMQVVVPKVERERSAVADCLLLPAVSGTGSHSNTLSTVVGTLGREGTMQEVEEVWEANPWRKKPKSSSSSNSPRNTESFHKLDESTRKSKDDDADIVTAVDGTLISATGTTKKAAYTQVVGDRIIDKHRTDGVKMDMDSGDTAQDMSDDDFGSSGVEDLLASKVKVTTEPQLLNLAKTPAAPKHSMDEAKPRLLEKWHQFISMHSKPFVSGRQKSLPGTPRELGREQNTCTQVDEEKTSLPVSDTDKRAAHRKKELTPSFSPSHMEAAGMQVSRKESLRCGLSGVILSDEESTALDHLSASPHSLEELEDRTSVTSTETEESVHINAGLKDSLLAPLSTMPEASNVDQLQDLVRELRLKLEKEFGQRKDLETRLSHLKKQKKQAKLLHLQQEQSSQQKQQEISSLMSRIKQLEYQGHTEQDSLVLRDHSLQDAHQRCIQLEEQCGALQVKVQQQEQLVNSLMVKLQTKERINLTLQDKLEELSSQTKYVSMKSCQTEDFLMALVQRESMQAQTDWVCPIGREDRQTQATPTMSESYVQTEASASETKLNILGSAPVPEVYCSIETSTKFAQTEHEQKVSKSERGTQSEQVGIVHASCQNTPLRAFKTSQTQINTKSSGSQTESHQDHFHVQKKIVNDLSCQTVCLNKQSGTQTDPLNFEGYVDAPKVSVQSSFQTEAFTAALQNILLDFSQDIKSTLKLSEDCQSTVLESISRVVSFQMGTLASSLTTTLQQISEPHSHQKLLEVQEGICQLQDTLETQVDVLRQLSNDSPQVEIQNLHDTIEKINVDLRSSLDTFGSRIIEALQSQVSSQQEEKALLASLMDQKHDNNKILTNISGQLDRRNDHDMEKFIDLKQHITSQLTEIKKAIESSSLSEDSGISGNLTRGVVERLDSIEKSLVLPGGRSCVSEELCGVQQLSDDLHKKISVLEELISLIRSDSKLDQAALIEQTKAINESNDNLTTLVKLRLSEANADLSEAIEENFRIVQDQLLHLQQTILQRINEISEHISVSEDKKASNLAKQMMEIASQVSGVHGGLVQLQTSVHQTHSTPMMGGMVDEALLASFKTYHEQATESLKFQNDSIIQQLEALQKQMCSSLIQGQNVKEQREIQLLKEALKEKESKLDAVEVAREQLQQQLSHQKVSLASLQSKEDEWKMKIETLQGKVKDLTTFLKEKDQEVQQEAAKSVAQSEDTVKLRQENFRLSSEHVKLSAVLQAEQQQRQWCEGELQSLREAKDGLERRMQEMISYVQESSMQRTPPTGRDTDEDNTLANWKQELKKLEAEKKKLEEKCTEQQKLGHHLELQLKEAEVALELEKNVKDELEKQLKKAKESVTRLQRELSDMRQKQEMVRDFETQQVELQMEVKSREAAMDTLRKRLEAVNKEKLDLKNNIMQLKEEKLSSELIKQEKEFIEQMQHKTEKQLHDLQQRISRDYVSKASLQALQKELESKYQLELSTKLAELNHIIQEQNRQQESLTKSKDSREQELKNELSRKSEEVIRLNAKLCVLDERGDTWRVRHDRLLALYQQQTDLNHSLVTAKKHHEDPLSISIQEIDKHLKTPLASSTFFGQLTTPVSLQLPPAPSNIDSYHYTHSEVLDRTLQSYLNSSTQSRYSATDDKPQAKISPLPPSSHHSQHLSRVPDLDQSRDEYVDLLKMKYGI